jgi:hypothetical protein
MYKELRDSRFNRTYVQAIPTTPKPMPYLPKTFPHPTTAEMISLLSTSGFALSLLFITTAVQATPINLFRRLAIDYVDCNAT